MGQLLRNIFTAAFMAVSMFAASAAMAQTLNQPAIASGWGGSNGSGYYSGSGIGDYRAGLESGATYNSFLTFSVPASAIPYTSATLRLDTGGVSQGPNVFEVREVTIDPAIDPIAIYNNVNGSTTFGTATANASLEIVEVTLNAAGLAAVNAARGSDISFGFVNMTLEPGTDIIFQFPPDTPRDLILTAPLPPPVPTLSEWALIGFGLALSVGAALYIQRRRLTA